jgi:hypothetical protein
MTASVVGKNVMNGNVASHGDRTNSASTLATKRAIAKAHDSTPVSRAPKVLVGSVTKPIAAFLFGSIAAFLLGSTGD